MFGILGCGSGQERSRSMNPVWPEEHSFPDLEKVINLAPVEFVLQQVSRQMTSSECP